MGVTGVERRVKEATAKEQREAWVMVLATVATEATGG